MTSIEFANGLRAAYNETASYENIEFTPGEYAQVLSEMERDSRFQVERSASGEILALNAAQAVSAGTGLIFLDNSNLAQSSSGVGNATAKIPLTVTEGAGSIDDPRMFEKGVKTVSAGGRVMAVADRASLALAGVSIGAKLGKAIDETLYNINPDWWDKNFPSINPKTWTDIAGDNEFGRNVINVLFGIDNDTNDVSMYVPEDVFAYYLYAFDKLGAWRNKTTASVIDNQGLNTDMDYPIRVMYGDEFFILRTYDEPDLEPTIDYHVKLSMPVWCCPFINTITSGRNFLRGFIFASKTAFDYQKSTALELIPPLYVSETATIKGETFKYAVTSIYSQYRTIEFDIEPNIYKISTTYLNMQYMQNIAYTMLFVEPEESIPGISDEPGDRAPINVDPSLVLDVDPYGNLDIDGTLNHIKFQLPDFYNDAVYQKTINDSGEDETKVYIKVPIPDNIDTPYPTTGNSSQLNPSITINNPIAQKIFNLTTNETQNPVNNPNPSPSNNTDTIKNIIFEIVNSINPEIIIDDIPDTLVPDIQNIVDTSDYPYPNPNPTTIIDTIRDTITTQIPEINPTDLPDSVIQNIIDSVTGNPNPNPAGGTPSTGSGDNGSPTTGTPPTTNIGESPEIVPIEDPASTLWAIYNPSASTLASFGNWLWTTNIWEMVKQMFENPVDAIIGVHKIFVNPITGGNKNIKCGYLDSGIAAPVVAKQYVTMDCGWLGVGEVFGNVFDYAPYTRISLFLPFIGFVNIDPSDVMRGRVNVKYTIDVLTGACIAEVNIDRDNCTSTLYSFTGNCAVTYPVTHGSYLGMLIGALQLGASSFITAENPELAMAVAPDANSMRINVSHSGQFGANAGAMGGKTPYLVITTPQVKMADSYEAFDGVGANATVAIGACSGYVKCKEVHLQVSAYEEEIKEIEQLLHNGILI